MRRWQHALVAGALLVLWLAQGTSVVAQSDGWSQPFELSDAALSRTSWFPDAAVGPDGTLSVIWCSFPTRSDTQGNVISVDSLMYRELRGGQWSGIQDIYSYAHPAGGNSEVTVRNSIVAGRDRKLHVVFRQLNDIVHFSAPADQARSAQAWSAYKPLAPVGGYYNALAIDSTATLHTLWTQGVVDTPDQPRPGCPNCANLFYRRSSDGGVTWSLSQNLSRRFEGANRPQIAVDQHDRIHIVWDEGFDWYAGSGVPKYGVYIRSDDGGDSWSAPVVFSLTGERTYQITLAVTPEGNPRVIYRTARHLYYQRSEDGGSTWSAPAEIPGIEARSTNDPNLDRYSAAIDGSGQLHVLAVGFPLDRAGATPSLLHLSYDGNAWSYPEVIVADARYPEWPRLVIGGNQLHAVWYTRTNLYGENDVKQVWYSSKTIDAAPVPPITLFTPTPVPLPTAEPTATPLPTPLPDPYASTELLKGPPAWERPSVAIIGTALLPVGALLAVVAFLARRR